MLSDEEDEYEIHANGDINSKSTRIHTNTNKNKNANTNSNGKKCKSTLHSKSMPQEHSTTPVIHSDHGDDDGEYHHTFNF